MTQDDYNNKFEVDKHNSELLKAAFIQVSDIRKFEIELYWKRANYFWALIAVAFAGYFAALSSDNIENKYFISIVIANIGFVFTFAWFLSSRGSKYWQENWENHLDMLENKITGPLYKTLLERPGHNDFFERMVTGPLSISVSKINQWVASYVMMSWVVVLLYSFYKSLKNISLINGPFLYISAHFFVVLLAFLLCCLMFFSGRTHKDKHAPKAILRETSIE